MEQKVELEPKIMFFAIFLTPCAIACIYAAIKLMTMTTSVVEPENDLVPRLLLALPILALGIFMSIMLVKVLLHLANFDMTFDEKQISITTPLAKQHLFTWEEIAGKEIHRFGIVAIVLKNGDRIKLRYGYLKNIEKFWEAYIQKVEQAS